jgi:hypothetical protein
MNEGVHFALLSFRHNLQLGSIYYAAQYEFMLTIKTFSAFFMGFQFL